MSVIKEGYLHKEGHINTNWNKRFFVLTNDSLTYYKDQTKKDLKGSYILDTTSKIEKARDRANKKYLLCLNANGTGGEQLFMHSESATESNEWEAAINSAIESKKPKPKVTVTQSAKVEVKKEENIAEAAEKARLDAEAAEKARLDAEAAEKARSDAEAAENARLDAEAAENARLDAEAAENARLDAEAAEKARLDAEAAEKARLDAEAAEKARLDAEAAENARLDAEAAEEARLGAEKARADNDDADPAEKARLDAEVVEMSRLAAEAVSKARQEADNAENARLKVESNEKARQEEAKKNSEKTKNGSNNSQSAVLIGEMILKKMATKGSYFDRFCWIDTSLNLFCWSKTPSKSGVFKQQRIKTVEGPKKTPAAAGGLFGKSEPEGYKITFTFAEFPAIDIKVVDEALAEEWVRIAKMCV